VESSPKKYSESDELPDETGDYYYRDCSSENSWIGDRVFGRNGRVSENKGIEYLYEVFPHLPAKHQTQTTHTTDSHRHRCIHHLPVHARCILLRGHAQGGRCE